MLAFRLTSLSNLEHGLLRLVYCLCGSGIWCEPAPSRRLPEDSSDGEKPRGITSGPLQPWSVFLICPYA